MIHLVQDLCSLYMFMYTYYDYYVMHTSLHHFCKTMRECMCVCGGGGAELGDGGTIIISYLV